MLYLGIDQHAKQLTISLRNSHGDVVLKRQVSTQPKRCLEFFAKLQQKADADGYITIVEVCGFNDWLLELLPKYGCAQTILIQPTKKPKVKTDRRDAHALSELLWVNQHRLRAGEPVRGIRQVVLPSKIDAENQRITLLRKDAGKMRTRATNRIKHILRRHNLQWQLPTKTFPTVKAIAWLKTVKLPDCDRAEMNWHLDELQRWSKRMMTLEEQIIERARGNELVELLRTIPGVGYYSALALACRVGDPNRFPKGKSLAHYWGLTPGVDDSGEGTGRRGRITKAGSTIARWVLAQVTVHVLRRDPVMKAWYKPIKKRRGSTVARVAVMRKMSTIVRNMLVNKQTYFECRDAMIERRKKQLQTKKKSA